MRLNKQYLDEALNELSKRREKNQKLEEKRRAEIYEKIPEYEQLEKELAAAMRSAVNSVFDKTAGTDAETELRKNRDIQKQMSELLEKNGYPADYLDPIYTCQKCKDKGNTGNEWCECLCRFTNEFAAAALNENAPLSRSNFGNFDLAHYPDETDGKTGMSPREMMGKNLEECKKFAENFSGKGNGILMMGGTGLGKTHLLLSIANVVIAKGFCVVYVSVPELIRKINDEQHERSEDDSLSLATSSDLLILDDLGAENNTSYCRSLLYEIINTRQNHNLPTIINTNLSSRELKEEYQDRLSSRMISMKTMLFCGRDNRVMLSENYSGT